MNGMQKKLISFFLTAILLITCAFGSVSATETDDGYTVITTVAQLDDIRNNIDENGKIYGKYRLGANIVFSEDETFVPIGNSATGRTPSMFIGEFDGNGYTIKNLTLKSDVASHTSLYLGLFAYNNGTIKNLIVDNVSMEITKCNYMNGGAIAGVVAGIDGRGKIVNCYAKGSFNLNKTSNATTTKLGGIVGQSAGGQITKTVSDVNINYVCNDVEDIYIGGITAENSGKISGCGNKGNIYAISKNESVIAGGIVGKLTGTTSAIQDCYNVGAVTGESGRTMCLGGIAGAMGSSSNKTKIIRNCNIGKITPTANFSGGGFTSTMATIASGAIIGNFNGDSSDNFYLKGTYSVAATNVNLSNTAGKNLAATEIENAEDVRTADALDKTTTWYLPTDTSVIPQLQAWKNIKDFKLCYAREIDEKYNAINVTQKPTINVEFDDDTFVTESKVFVSEVQLGSNKLTVSHRGVEKEIEYLGYVLGDVNFDANITVTDITKTIGAIANGEDLESGIVPADMDNNEDITVTDVVEIRKIILGK